MLRYYATYVSFKRLNIHTLLKNTKIPIHINTHARFSQFSPLLLKFNTLESKEPHKFSSVPHNVHVPVFF